MDFYGDGSVTDLSVNDVFENEVQSEVNEILRSDSARFSPQATTELSSLQTTGLDLEATEFTILPNYFQEQAVQTTAQDANPTSVLTTTANNTVDLSQISGMEGENGIHSLLVDPQTGMPVSTSALQLDPNSAQASLQMIVNSLPELQAQIAASASSTETLGLSNIGNIITQAPILSLNTQQQPPSPLVLSTGSQNGNQNLTFQNGTFQATDLSHINLSNFNELAAQTLISQLQQQQLHLANGNVQNASVSDLNSALKIQQQQQKGNVHPASPKAKVDKVYPKPAYSYSCLITMALKNSQTGCLPVSEIYQFMCENFPYFKTAPDGWKNSVRHNLSLNKCFAKIEKPQVNNGNGSARKGCLWAMNPEKQAKMEEEVHKWTQKDPSGIKRSMAKPEEFSRIEALSRISSSPKSSPRESTPPIATVPPPLQSIISTATTTTVTPSETKQEVTHNVFAEQFFNPSLNLLDPTLTQLDGDLGLQDNLLDTFNDISSLDVPVTTSPFTAFSFSSPILDSSPLKDTSHTVSSAFLLDSPQTHTASSLQFCSPTRAPQVTAFM